MSFADLSDDTIEKIVSKGDGITFARMLQASKVFHLPNRLWTVWTDLTLKQFTLAKTLFSNCFASAVSKPQDEPAANELSAGASAVPKPQDEPPANELSAGASAVPKPQDEPPANELSAGASTSTPAPISQLVYMHQHLAECIYINRQVYNHNLLLKFPSLNEYTFVFDLFCGGTHLASWSEVFGPGYDEYVSDCGTWHAPDVAQKLISEITSLELDTHSGTVYLNPTNSQMVRNLKCSIAVARRSDFRTMIFSRFAEVEETSQPENDEAKAPSSIRIDFEYEQVFEHITDDYNIYPSLSLDMNDFTASSFRFRIESDDKEMWSGDLTKFLFLEMALPYRVLRSAIM